MGRVNVITLLTDFGTADGYAGIMHGVILRINPQAAVVHLSHDIAAQDVRAAAFVLSAAYAYFPQGTIHVAVVDPGVGSGRRVMALRTAKGTFLAPDNGVLSYIWARETALEVVQVANSRYWLSSVSSTFHGRDVFAPVAAYLSLGVPLSELGPPLHDPVKFPIVEPEVREPGTVVGEVQHVDRFGNLVTNIPWHLLPSGQAMVVHVGGRQVKGPLKAYALAERGELLALVSSTDFLEVAVRDGSAAALLGVGRGAEVVVNFCPQGAEDGPQEGGEA